MFFFSPLQKNIFFPHYRISKVKKDDYEFSSPSSSQTYGSLDTNIMKEDHSESGGFSREREASPELAKISALITRPPKQKPSSEYENNRGFFLFVLFSKEDGIFIDFGDFFSLWKFCEISIAIFLESLCVVKS